ncbi:MAG: hypothetical protein H6613_15510 [Ignavibacteriales bacterium]|nr:hypothetical protein [Ignavibacteriales bacterium]
MIIKNNLGYFCFLGALGQAANLILAKEAFQLGEINAFVATFYRMVPSIPFMFLLGSIYRRKEIVLKYLNIKRRSSTNYYWVDYRSILGITFSLLAITNTKVGIVLL